MSEGYIYRQACGLLNASNVAEPMRGDAYAALRAADKRSLTFLLHALLDAQVSAKDVWVRGAAVFVQYAATNLADDLSDGDCGYLKEPSRVGPIVQYFLQSLFLRALGQAKVPSEVVREVGADLMRAAEAQDVDVQCRSSWTLERAKWVARGTSGLQYSGYLRVLWSGTDLAPFASDVGVRLGSAAHVVADIADGDFRYTGLSRGARAALLDWAEAELQARGWPFLRCVDTVVHALRPALARARAELLSVAAAG